VKNPPATVTKAAAKIEAITGIRRGLPQVRNFLDSQGLHRRKVGVIPAKAGLDSLLSPRFRTLEERI